jgi:thiol-disulfide isomerase/thioredoxin
MKFIAPVVVIILCAVGALVFIKKQVGPRTEETEATTSTQVGSAIPDFPLATIQGKSAKFSEIISSSKAKVVLVNFWATWCEACMVEMPSLIQLRAAYKDKGLEVIGINLDENPETVVPKAMKELGIIFPVFNDNDNKISEYFDVRAIPLSIVVNSDRKILYIENGEKNWNDQEVHHQIEQWLSPEKS